MIKTILIDDEIQSLTSLELELEAYCPSIKIIGKFTNPEKAIKEINNLKPDLIFLDIQMPGISGFELLNKVDKIDFDIIFITAFDEYALKAFDFNAIDYIMKPIRKTKLLSSVEKVRKQIDKRIDQDDIRALLTNFKLQNDSDIKTIAIPNNSGYEMIHIEEIKYLQAQNNYTWIYRITGEKYLISKPIKKVSEMIPYAHFYRSHKSFVVNLKQVVRLVRGHGSYLILKDDTEIPVSRLKKEGLLKLLKI